MKCPICGEDSGCAMEAGKPIGECWCVKRSFPPETITLVPEALRERACICEACLDRLERRDDAI
ncbi:MAG: cysteine-rich CWC family protein [Cohnella sp.]|nr:cysteine-rich CWC family protein [Cohnella sp.]